MMQISLKLYVAFQETRFLEVAAMFTDNCIEYIKRHRYFLDNDPETHSDQLEYVLK